MLWLIHRMQHLCTQSKAPAEVIYRTSGMPPVSSLVEPWPPELEAAFASVELPNTIPVCNAFVHQDCTCNCVLFCMQVLCFPAVLIHVGPPSPRRHKTHDGVTQDIELLDLCRVVCALLGVPLQDTRPVEALHLLFSAYLDLRASPWLDK